MTTHTRVRRTASETQEQIRATAVSLFLRFGYEATTLDHIATQLGITRPAILWHFKSKDALLKAVTDPVFDDMCETLNSLPVTETPTLQQRLDAVEAILDTLIKHRFPAALIIRFTTENTICEIGETARKRNEQMAVALSGAQFHTDPLVRVRTLACLAAMTGLMSSRLPLDLDSTQRDALVPALVALLES